MIVEEFELKKEAFEHLDRKQVAEELMNLEERLEMLTVPREFQRKSQIDGPGNVGCDGEAWMIREPSSCCCANEWGCGWNQSRLWNCGSQPGAHRGDWIAWPARPSCRAGRRGRQTPRESRTCWAWTLERGV